MEGDVPGLALVIIDAHAPQGFLQTTQDGGVANGPVLHQREEPLVILLAHLHQRQHLHDPGRDWKIANIAGLGPLQPSIDIQAVLDMHMGGLDVLDPQRADFALPHSRARGQERRRVRQRIRPVGWGPEQLFRLIHGEHAPAPAVVGQGTGFLAWIARYEALAPGLLEHDGKHRDHVVRAFRRQRLALLFGLRVDTPLLGEGTKPGLHLGGGDIS